MGRDVTDTRHETSVPAALTLSVENHTLPVKTGSREKRKNQNLVARRILATPSAKGPANMSRKGPGGAGWRLPGPRGLTEVNHAGT